MYVRLVLFILVTFYNYGGILAAGMLAHTLVGYRTTKYFAEVTPTASPRNFKKYNDAIINNFEAVDGGSDFPDFLYACGKYSDHHDAAEAAHWPPFHAAFINYIRSSVPNFREDDWSEETKKLVAFLYGVAVHYNADEIWEGLTDELGNGYGFIRALAIMNENAPGTSGALEGPANNAADFYISYNYDLDHIKPWDRYFPLEDMVNVFHLTPKNSTNNFTDVTLQSLKNCRILFDLGLWAEKVFGKFMFHLYVAEIKQLPFVAENLLNYPIGGLDYMSLRANYVWQRIARWLDVGAPAMPPPNVDDDDQDDRTNHKIFQSMKEFLPYTSKIKKFITSLKIKNMHAGELFDFIDIKNVKKGIFFKKNNTILVTEEMEDVLCNMLLKLIQIKLNYSIDVKIYRRRDLIPKESLLKFKGSSFRTFDSIASDSTIVGGVENVGYTGHAIASGDFNDDGIQDFVYSAYGEGIKGTSPQSGNVYICYSGIDCNGTNQKSLQVLYGDKLKQERFGFTLEVLDYNLDGVDDLVVGAPLSSFQNSEIPVPFDSQPDYRAYGKIYIYYGRKGTGLSNGNRIDLYTKKRFSVIGSVLSKGDVDLDGNDDLIVAAPYSPMDVKNNSKVFEPLTGSLYVIKSSPTNTNKNEFSTDGVTSTYDISTIAYAVINGGSKYDLFGASISIDNERVYVGAPGHRAQYKGDSSNTTTVGCIYGYKLPLIPSNHENSDFSIISPILQIIGKDRLGEFGKAIAKPLGHNYLIVSAPASTISEKVKQAGLIYVFENINGTNGIVDLFNSPLISLSPVSYSVIASSTSFARFGQKLFMHDIDNDGNLDLLISSPMFTSDMAIFEKRELGAVYVYKNFDHFFLEKNLTSNDASIILYGRNRGGRFGSAICSGRNSSKNNLLMISSPYASVNNLEMNGIVELYVDV